MSFTVVLLVVILWHLNNKIQRLNELSGQSFVEESSTLRQSVLNFVITFSVRILFTVLQMADVFSVVDLRQFWSIQFEFLLCLICEVLPPFLLIYGHLTNKIEDE